MVCYRITDSLTVDSDLVTGDSESVNEYSETLTIDTDLLSVDSDSLIGH